MSKPRQPLNETEKLWEGHRMLERIKKHVPCVAGGRDYEILIALTDLLRAMALADSTQWASKEREAP